MSDGYFLPNLKEDCDGFCDLRWLCSEEVRQGTEVWEEEIEAIKAGMSANDARQISYVKRQRLNHYFNQEKRDWGFGDYVYPQNYTETLKFLPRKDR